MQEQGFTNKDWTLFRSKLPGWQEAYMDRLNKEYIKILSADKKPSDKFWNLEKRLKVDKYKIGVSIDMRRSQFIPNMVSLIEERVISLADLEEFSDSLKETISFVTRG